MGVSDATPGRTAGELLTALRSRQQTPMPHAWQMRKVMGDAERVVPGTASPDVTAGAGRGHARPGGVYWSHNTLRTAGPTNVHRTGHPSRPRHVVEQPAKAACLRPTEPETSVARQVLARFASTAVL